jgi:hypothetical protein
MENARDVWILYALFAWLPSLLLFATSMTLVMRGVRASEQGRYTATAWYMAAAATPVIVFAAIYAVETYDQFERRRYVQSLRTTPLADYPRALVVSGGILTDAEAGNLAVAAGFQTIDRVGYWRTVSVSHSPECTKSLASWWRWKRPDKIPAHCLQVTTSPPNQTPERYVLLLDGEHTTQRTTHVPRFSDRALELWVVEDGKSSIIDYWENPDDNRPAFPYYVSWVGFVRGGAGTTRDFPRPYYQRNLDAREFVLRNLAPTVACTDVEEDVERIECDQTK